jgi:gamma-glutamyltranspeptidase
MAFGSPGGDCQDQWALLFLLNVVEFGMNLQEAVEAPTFWTSHFPSSFYPRQAQPGSLNIESRVFEGMRETQPPGAAEATSAPKAKAAGAVPEAKQGETASEAKQGETASEAKQGETASETKQGGAAREMKDAGASETTSAPEPVREALAARGHRLVVMGAWSGGNTLAVSRDPQTGLLCAAASPRVEPATAAGF